MHFLAIFSKMAEEEEEEEVTNKFLWSLEIFAIKNGKWDQTIWKCVTAISLYQNEILIWQVSISKILPDGPGHGLKKETKITLNKTEKIFSLKDDKKDKTIVTKVVKFLTIA